MFSEYKMPELNERYDKALSSYLGDGLIWLPWVGKNYDSVARKLLLVGESHYYDEARLAVALDSGFTRLCIEESIFQEWWTNRTYTNAVKAVVGREFVDFKEVWRNIAFFNFIPKVMLKKGELCERPQANDFRAGWASFVNVVRVLKPDVCVFIGVTASNFFVDEMTRLSVPFRYEVDRAVCINGIFPRRAVLNLGGHEVRLVFIKHCGSFFSWQVWHDYLRKIL